jgi:hypothetical protein
MDLGMSDRVKPLVEQVRDIVRNEVIPLEGDYDAEIGKLKMPAYHNRPAAPTNLTLHQAIDIDVPIGCGDAPVWPGDVIVGDGEGVVVIPAGIADEIANETFEMTAFEDFVTEQVLTGRSIVGLYPATDPQTTVDFTAWRKKNGR